MICIFRLLKRYTICEGHTLSVPEIQANISTFLGDVSSLPQLGRLIKHALPWVKKVKATIEVDGLKKRAHVYKDLGLSADAEDLVWDDLKEYLPHSSSSTQRQRIHVYK